MKSIKLFLFVFRYVLALEPTPSKYQACQPAAIEGQKYSIDFTSPTTRGIYYWQLTPNKLQKDIFLRPCMDKDTSECNGPISALIFVNDTYIRTVLTFQKVSTFERGMKIRCVHWLSEFSEKEVLTCAMSVHALPSYSRCGFNMSRATGITLRCMVHMIYPELRCWAVIAGVNINTNITSFTYTLDSTDITANYVNATCTSHLTGLPIGPYSVKVMVDANNSLGPQGDILSAKEGYSEVLNITLPRTYMSLVPINTKVCADGTKAGQTTHLLCKADGFTSRPEVTWFWDSIEINKSKTHTIIDQNKNGIYYLQSSYKFHPSNNYVNKNITCHARSDAEAGKVSFQITERPQRPPAFINASDGWLIFDKGHADITCLVPGDNPGFTLVNITCRSVDGQLKRNVSPVNHGHLVIEDAAGFDHGECLCFAIHNLYCYNLSARASVRILNQTTIPDQTVVEQPSMGKLKYEIVYITLIIVMMILLMFIVSVVVFFVLRKFQNLKFPKSCNVSEEHIYSEPQSTPERTGRLNFDHQTNCVQTDKVKRTVSWVGLKEYLNCTDPAVSPLLHVTYLSNNDIKYRDNIVSTSSGVTNDNIDHRMDTKDLQRSYGIYDTLKESNASTTRIESSHCYGLPQMITPDSQNLGTYITPVFLSCNSLNSEDTKHSRLEISDIDFLNKDVSGIQTCDAEKPKKHDINSYMHRPNEKESTVQRYSLKNHNEHYMNSSTGRRVDKKLLTLKYNQIHTLKTFERSLEQK